MTALYLDLDGGQYRLLLRVKWKSGDGESVLSPNKTVPEFFVSVCAYSRLALRQRV